MRAWRRRVLTVAVVGLLLGGGCTAAPPLAPPAGPVARLEGTAPVRMPLPAAPRGWSADRVLGVVWRGAPGAESAELGWVDALSLRPRPGRRLSLGRYGALWAVSPDRSLAVFGDGGDGDHGSVLVADLRRLRRVGTVRLGWLWQSPFAASWLGRSRVLLAGVGVTDGPEGDLEAATVSVVDLAAGRVVAKRRMVGALLAAGRLPDGMVLLLGGAGSVGRRGWWWWTATVECGRCGCRRSRPGHWCRRTAVRGWPRCGGSLGWRWTRWAGGRSWWAARPRSRRWTCGGWGSGGTGWTAGLGCSGGWRGGCCRRRRPRPRTGRCGRRRGWVVGCWRYGGRTTPSR